MKMRRVFLFAMMFCVFGVVEAQTRMRKSEIERIKRDTAYFFGENSLASTQEEAFELSMASLYQDIVGKCNADAIYLGSGSQREQLLKIIETYENKIAEKMIQIPIVEDFVDDRYSYFVYMKRSDFRALCSERHKSIERLALRGYKSENDENLQLEDALKSYYWGMMLCLAHPYANSLKIVVDDEEFRPYEWFVDRIDGAEGVLKSFSFVIPKEGAVEESPEGTLVKMNVRSSFGIPISNLRFEYYNGQKYIPTSVNDGKAIVVLKQSDMKQLNIRIEYEFKKESVVDPEVNKVLNTIKPNLRFSNIRHVVYLDRRTNDSGTEKNNADSEWRKIDRAFKVEESDYLSIMQEVEAALRERNHVRVKHRFTEEGYGMLDTLASYGMMTVVGKQDYNFIKIGSQVICRGINMQFDFRNHVSFNRDVVFRFDNKTKKITSIAFRLSSVTEKDIVAKTKWSEEDRLILINFLEDYQTAYALKRHDYLESIYSDDALIIVGHVVKRTVIPDMAQFNLSEDEVKLMQYDKNAYFKNLSRVFMSQAYISVHFADADFTKATALSDREIYGVRLLQEYNSTTYGDVGYLFILVDLTNEKPLIHVRAWQPDEVELDKLMDMKDLRF